MTPDLYRYAADRGALHWEVQQEIDGIKTSSRSGDRTPGHDHRGVLHRRVVKPDNPDDRGPDRGLSLGF